MITVIDGYCVFSAQPIDGEELECVKLGLGYSLEQHHLTSSYYWDVELQKNDFQVQYNNDSKKLTIKHKKTNNKIIEPIDVWMRIRQEEIELGLWD